jgi:flagellar hook assembly protein FlgD
MVDIAITKTAGMGFVGSGELVGIVMGVPANNTSMVRLEIYDIKAIDHDGKDVVIAGSVYRGEASSPTQEEHQQPAKFELMANYPNPFNPNTTVMFSLTEEAYVTLRVYDVLGREVVTLLDGERTGGVHAMQWDGKNSSGNQVESGVYYCRMSVRASSGQQFNQAQRMVFMK